MTTIFIELDSSKVNAAETQKPESRRFRDAWHLNGGVIEVDMDKARDLWREKIRQARTPKFEALDAEFMKALETGEAERQAEVSFQKDALRNATKDPAIDAALTPEQLEQVQPAGLHIQ